MCWLSVLFLLAYCWFALQVIFLHPAPMHPHIYTNGHICLGNLSFYAYLINLSYDLFLDKVVP